MAYLKRLKNNELIGGIDNTDVYPYTTAEAVYDKSKVTQQVINDRQNIRVTTLEGKTRILEDFKTVVEAYMEGGGEGGSSAGIYYAK